jgi:hypothetical protein
MTLHTRARERTKRNADTRSRPSPLPRFWPPLTPPPLLPPLPLPASLMRMVLSGASAAAPPPAAGAAAVVSAARGGSLLSAFKKVCIAC